MIIGLLTTLFVFLSFLLVFIIFLQKGKSSLGLGTMGGTNQMLFGGSGGQDIFQKSTWVMVALFMGGSLLISIAKSRSQRAPRMVQQQQLPLPMDEEVND